MHEVQLLWRHFLQRFFLETVQWCLGKIDVQVIRLSFIHIAVRTKYM